MFRQHATSPRFKCFASFSFRVALRKRPSLATMADPQSREEIAAQAVAVRAELKTWEKEFVASHEGKKASQDDIKERPDIGILQPKRHSSLDQILTSSLN